MNAIAHHTQRLLSQLPIAEKSNEIPSFAPLPLAGTLVTANAGHCPRAHARFVYDKDADYLFLTARGAPRRNGFARHPGGVQRPALRRSTAPVAFSRHHHGRITRLMILTLPWAARVGTRISLLRCHRRQIFLRA